MSKQVFQIKWDSWYIPPENYKLSGMWFFQDGELFISVSFKVMSLKKRKRIGVPDICFISEHDFIESYICGEEKKNVDGLGFFSYIQFLEAAFHNRKV